MAAIQNNASRFLSRADLSATPENAVTAAGLWADVAPISEDGARSPQCRADLAKFKAMIAACDEGLLTQVSPSKVEIIFRPNAGCELRNLSKGLTTATLRLMRERAVGQRGFFGSSARPVHGVMVSRSMEGVKTTMTVGYPDGQPTCLRVLPVTDMMSQDDRKTAENFNPRVQSKIETNIHPVVFELAQLIFYTESQELAAREELPPYSNDNLRLLMSNLGLPISLIDFLSEQHQNCQTGTSAYITRLAELQNVLVEEVQRNPQTYPALTGIQRVEFDQFDWSQVRENISGAVPIAAGWAPGGQRIEASLSFWQKVHLSPFSFVIAPAFLAFQRGGSIGMRAISGGAAMLRDAAQRTQDVITDLRTGENTAI